MKVMNFIERFLIVTFVLLSTLYVNSENLTYNEKIQLNKDAVDLLMKYNETCHLNRYSHPAEFKQLFEKNAEEYIFNDLMGLSVVDSISVKGYIDLLAGGKVRYPDITIKNVKNVSSWKQNSKHYVTMSFEKQMEYSTKSSGTILHSVNYYGLPYQYEMTVCSDQKTGRCYIVDLESEVPNGMSRLSLDHTHVEISDPRDSLVTCSGVPMKIYSGQALVKRRSLFEYHDDDVKLNVLTIGDENDYHYIFKYKPKRWRVSANADISVCSFFTVPESNVMNVKQMIKDFGVDVGYIFPSSRKVKFGVFFGVGMSLGSTQIAVDKVNYNYTAPEAADIDGDKYQRHVCISDMLQQTNFKHIIVPVYADIEYRFNNRVGIYADLGVKAYVNIASSAWNMSFTSDVYGVYPQYGKLTITDPIFNDFGLSTTSLTQIRQADLAPISIDALCGVGVRVKLFGPVMLNVGARYQYGIMSLLKGSGYALSLYNGVTSEWKAPLVYRVEGGSNIRDLMDYTGDVFHNILSINASIVVKF